ncbi:hypothetical protein PR048_005652 [Dryococelus australis]|uniref:Uncharacterized protein n=1 Tax=Dryococelus australis TaxID=614101 RepID=A0ABQ9I8S3_9NEOP|nr:hypothetical protein PR048_005652 [Dryococelus australis]
MWNNCGAYEAIVENVEHVEHVERLWSIVLQASSRTVGFTCRYHTLSSIQATNTSLAIVPQSPVVVHTLLRSRTLGQTASIKDCRPLGCGSASQSHQNILASSLNVSETLAGERRSVTAVSLATIGICGIPRRGTDSHERIVPGRGESEVGLRLRRGAAESAPATAQQLRSAKAGKQEIPEKTRSSAASFGTIPAFENPVITQPGIEPVNSKSISQPFRRVLGARPIAAWIPATSRAPPGRFAVRCLLPSSAHMRQVTVPRRSSPTSSMALAGRRDGARKRMTGEWGSTSGSRCLRAALDLMVPWLSTMTQLVSHSLVSWEVFLQLSFHATPAALPPGVVDKPKHTLHPCRDRSPGIQRLALRQFCLQQYSENYHSSRRELSINRNTRYTLAETGPLASSDWLWHLSVDEITRGRCGGAVKQITSDQDELGSIPGEVILISACDERHRVPEGFSRVLPFPPLLHSTAAPASPHCILTGRSNLSTPCHAGGRQQGNRDKETPPATIVWARVLPCAGPSALTRGRVGAIPPYHPLPGHLHPNNHTAALSQRSPQNDSDVWTSSPAFREMKMRERAQKKSKRIPKEHSLELIPSRIADPENLTYLHLSRRKVVIAIIFPRTMRIVGKVLDGTNIKYKYHLRASEEGVLRSQSLASRETLSNSWAIPERRGKTAAICYSASASLWQYHTSLHNDPEECGIPTWSAFNSILSNVDIPQTTAAFTPILLHIATEFSAMIAKEIQLLRPEEFSNLFLGLGGFFLAKDVMNCLGKYLAGTDTLTANYPSRPAAREMIDNRPGWRHNPSFSLPEESATWECEQEFSAGEESVIVVAITLKCGNWERSGVARDIIGEDRRWRKLRDDGSEYLCDVEGREGVIPESRRLLYIGALLRTLAWCLVEFLKLIRFRLHTHQCLQPLVVTCSATASTLAIYIVLCSSQGFFVVRRFHCLAM